MATDNSGQTAEYMISVAGFLAIQTVDISWPVWAKGMPAASPAEVAKSKFQAYRIHITNRQEASRPITLQQPHVYLIIYKTDTNKIQTEAGQSQNNKKKSKKQQHHNIHIRCLLPECITSKLTLDASKTDPRTIHFQLLGWRSISA